MGGRGDLISDKKGLSLVLSRIIFLSLNILVFSGIFFFVYSSSTGALVYEKAYAKEIALLLDSSEPVSQISIDFSKGLEIAEDNDMGDEEKKNLVSLDNNKVVVKLSQTGGYELAHFSGNEINYYFDGNFLIITIN